MFNWDLNEVISDSEGKPEWTGVEWCVFSKLFPRKNALIINLELGDPLNLFPFHIFLLSFYFILCVWAF